MHRTWYIAPIVFIVLSLIGLQNLIARWMEPSPQVISARNVGAVAAAPRVLPLPSPVAEAVASPTAAVPPTVTATAQTLVIEPQRAATATPLANRLAATPTAMPPTAVPPTRTPTVSPIDVAPPPRRTGND